MDDEPLWRITFKHIPPEMMTAPGYCIREERMGIRAATKESAIQKFFKDAGTEPSHYRILDVEKMT